MTLRLSATQLDMFFRCGEQWRRRYVEGEKIPPGIAAHVGSGVHKGAEVNFAQKIETEEDLPLSDVQDAARDGYLHRLRDEGVYLTREDAQRREQLFAEGVEKSVEAVTVLHEKMAPHVFPASVELEVRATDEEVGVDWIGYVDVLQDNGTLHDIKTTGKVWTQKDVDASTQGTLYPRLVKATEGVEVVQIEFDIFRKLKTQTKYEPLFTERDDSDWRALQERTRTMMKMVDAGHAPPTVMAPFPCSEKWCGFWST